MALQQCNFDLSSEESTGTLSSKTHQHPNMLTQTSESTQQPFSSDLEQQKLKYDLSKESDTSIPLLEQCQYSCALQSGSQQYHIEVSDKETATISYLEAGQDLSLLLEESTETPSRMDIDVPSISESNAISILDNSNQGMLSETEEIKDIESMRQNSFQDHIEISPAPSKS